MVAKIPKVCPYFEALAPRPFAEGNVVALLDAPVGVIGALERALTHSGVLEDPSCDQDTACSDRIDAVKPDIFNCLALSGWVDIQPRPVRTGFNVFRVDVEVPRALALLSVVPDGRRAADDVFIIFNQVEGIFDGRVVVVERQPIVFLRALHPLFNNVVKVVLERPMRGNNDALLKAPIFTQICQRESAMFVDGLVAAWHRDENAGHSSVVPHLRGDVK